jgi:hypothetical protein
MLVGGAPERTVAVRMPVAPGIDEGEAVEQPFEQSRELITSDTRSAPPGMKSFRKTTLWKASTKPTSTSRGCPDRYSFAGMI